MQFLRLLLFSLLTSFISSAFSQGKINAVSVECLGDITNFSYTPPSGRTLSSISWNFGDGYTSSATAPTHTYGSIGKFTILVQASFTNSTNAVDSQKIEVFGLPKPAFYFLKTSDTCFLSNQVCFKDTSSPAIAGQTITSRLLVWGDGSFSTSINPKKFDSICHTYGAPDKYTVKLELTDKYGCKNGVNLITNVVENIKTKFTVTSDFVNCSTARVCLRNTSTQATPSNSHYKWYIDTFRVDTGFYFNTSICRNFTTSKLITIRLIANANNYCIDTTTKTLQVTVDSLPTFMTLLDTVRCFNDNSLNEATIRNVKRDDIKWYVDGGYNPLVKSNTLYFNTQSYVGKHNVRVEIIRGSCVHTVNAYYRIMAPIARIKFIDINQCFSNREVYFYDVTQNINRDRIKYKWVIEDPSGDNCINYRTKDQNKYKNCNISNDWWTRHQYPKNTGKSLAMLIVTDTVTGCFDTAKVIVDMSDCSPILKPDSFRVCQGDFFFDDVKPPYPKKFTIDSGKTWRNFPEILDKPLRGKYDVGYVFETLLPEWAEVIGDDSIKIHTDTISYFDTIFRGQYIRVVPPIEDSVTVVAYNECRPFRVVVKFMKGDFKKGESLQVYWGDAGNYDSTFTKDIHIDSIIHIYNYSGINAPIKIVLTNINGCISRKQVEVQKGFIMSFNTPKYINCKYDSVCFYPGVYSFRENKFWTQNTPNNRLKWDFPDAGGINNKFSPCVRFNKGGLLPFRLYINDSFGCKDTLVDSVFVQDVRANIKNTARIVYCSELKQFFDSSSFNKNPKYRKFLPVFYLDSIKRFAWQFGNGTFSSLQRNPLQTLNTSMDSIPAAHMVETYSGCVDTVRFNIKVIGPKPYFNIMDTIGCKTLTAVFNNLSRNCKQYIWQFGDSANTTLQKFDKQQVSFNYTKPGRYYISLVGIDTIFNPFTNKYQYCYNTFPDKLFQKDTQRTVLVLPLEPSGIQAIDTVCAGDNVVFNSLSDTAYQYDVWSFSDTSLMDTIYSQQHTHRFKKAGLYTVKLNPYYGNTIKDQCRDSAIKNVLVLGVKASFTIDPASQPPQFIFHSTSTPSFAGLRWDFGQAGSPSSTDNDPSYNYGNDTGRYNVCLIASLPYGCADTTCQLVISDYISDFKLYNVITPGIMDGKNDQFDIQIEGESFYDLKIYNRWGILVYSSTEDADNTQSLNWNGKVMNSGATCPAGTYYYLFNYALKNASSDIKSVQGTITVIR